MMNLIMFINGYVLTNSLNINKTKYMIFHNGGKNRQYSKNPVKKHFIRKGSNIQLFRGSYQCNSKLESSYRYNIS